MAEGFDLKVVRLHRFDSDSKTKAFVDVAIGDFIVKGLRVVRGENGFFVDLPHQKGKDGKWYSSFYPATQEAKDSLSELVLAAYKE